MFTDIGTLEFWLRLLESYGDSGPLPAILLAFLESFIPPLPLIAIVGINVAAHGPLAGFLYSWAGTCIGCTLVFLFHRRYTKRLVNRLSEKHEKMKKAQLWVDDINRITLFMIILMPFTPSAFVNYAFGVSDYDIKTYLLILYSAKLIMIMLLSAFGQSVVTAFENPVFIFVSVIMLAFMIFLSKTVSKRNQI
jgi:uncharacterized membrane protein YdjX (TVP38/TMEM64 family)